MKIAAITISLNDGYKLSEWFNHYLEYKNDIYLHIIVDNGSQPEYFEEVKRLFIDSVIIRRETNGGSTSAYNDGIEYAIKKTETDAIMLIANDVKIEKGGVVKLYDFLSSNNYGMVSPVILSKDSLIIEDLGSEITYFMYMKPFGIGMHLDSITNYSQDADASLGGMNLASRSFYEKVGLQDEDLFMYSDEVDMAIRARKAGLKMGVIKEVKAWHQHININGRKERPPFSAFLIGRNKIYLGYKHFSLGRALLIFIFQVFLFFKGLIAGIKSMSKIQYQFYFLFGSFCGILRIKKNFRFIVNN